VRTTHTKNVRTLSFLTAAALAAAALANVPPAAPIITEPVSDGVIRNPEDVHMETGPFSDPDLGDTHRCTDWEIWTITPAERVWAASCITGLEKVHIHLGDGLFQGSHAGRVSLLPSTNFRLQVRHRDSSNEAATEWSPWSQRFFSTGSGSTIFPLELDDISDSPAPSWKETTGRDIVLPAAGATPAALVLETIDGAALEFRAATGSTNTIINPPGLPEHGALRVRAIGGASGLAAPESDVTFADDHGREFSAFLPGLAVPAMEEKLFWIAANGASYEADAGQTEPDFSTLAHGAPVPWVVMQPGYKVEIVTRGLQLPVNVAFVPNPRPEPDAPLFYITELYGTIKVVRRDGVVGTYISGLLNFNPTGDFPGSGEQGLSGLAVDAATGDVFAACLYDAAPPNGPHYPKVMRFRSLDGGLTASSQQIILNMVGESQGQSHQISNVSIGPDNKLYVHMGDGFDASTSQNLASFRGKVLRMNFDGTPLADNPFYNGGTPDSRDYIFAYGFRNPFGGAWRAADNLHYEVENGPSVDRFAQVVRARNYGYTGSDNSMRTFALYNWDPSHAPVNITFVQPQTFGGSGFPAAKQGHAFVSESGPTWGTGAQTLGKRIVEFTLDAAGNVTSGPTTLVEYNGNGKASCVGLTAGPDGLYFTDLYKDEQFQSPIDPGANVLRVRFVGAADFSADVTSGLAPLDVHFTDASNAPNPTSWTWDFGDGSVGSGQNPTHTYTQDGLYNVRLVVVGSSGPVVTQKNAYIRVGSVPSIALIGVSMPPAAGDAAIATDLRSRGFDVTSYDDEPANRPSAAQLAAAHDLVLVSSTITSANVAGQFRTVDVPVIFWEQALLRTDREALADNAVVQAGTSISISNTSHPITAGLAAGNLPVFTSTQNFSLASGTIAPAPGTRVLATFAGGPNPALIASEQGAPLLAGYIAPARRVFYFLEDSSYLAATAANKDLLLRCACWATDSAPRILTQPQPSEVTEPSPAVFSVSARGAGVSYRWRKNGVDLSSGGNIFGATSPTLTIDPTTPADEGAYDVVITGICGTLTSNPAPLSVLSCPADFNHDGQVDFFDYLDFASAFDAEDPIADFNEDGQVDFFDYLDFAQAFDAGCE
jgi:glucose/arabinose dehydrogenase/PKD repeat protein